jgi:hypothetical protein
MDKSVTIGSISALDYSAQKSLKIVGHFCSVTGIETAGVWTGNFTMLLF